MAFCRKCGKELADTESFCSVCSTKVDGINFSDAVSSVKRGTAQIAEKVTKNVQGSDYKSKLLNSYNGLQSAKTMFLVTLGSVLLNFILMFFDMAKINLFIVSESGSFIKIMNDIKDLASSYGGGGDAEVFLPLLTISIILTLASLVLAALPVLLGKSYNKKFLILNYITMIYNFLIYLVMILGYSASEGSYSTTEVTFMAYVYLAETIAVIIITKMFSNKVKAVQKAEAAKAAEAQGEEQ